jgi:hypothetical protein
MSRILARGLHMWYRAGQLLKEAAFLEIAEFEDTGEQIPFGTPDPKTVELLSKLSTDELLVLFELFVNIERALKTTVKHRAIFDFEVSFIRNILLPLSEATSELHKMITLLTPHVKPRETLLEGKLFNMHEDTRRLADIFPKLISQVTKRPDFREVLFEVARWIVRSERAKGFDVFVRFTDIDTGRKIRIKNARPLELKLGTTILIQEPTTPASMLVLLVTDALKLKKIFKEKKIEISGLVTIIGIIILVLLFISLMTDIFKPARLIQNMKDANETATKLSTSIDENIKNLDIQIQEAKAKGETKLATALEIQKKRWEEAKSQSDRIIEKTKEGLEQEKTIFDRLDEAFKTVIGVTELLVISGVAIIGGYLLITLLQLIRK